VFERFLSLVLRPLGFVTAAGGILSNLLDLDFIKELDLLRGFQGTLPHVAALAFYFLVNRIAGSWFCGLPEARVRTMTIKTGIAACIFFALALNYVVALPTSWFAGGGTLARAYATLLCYGLFYVFLGVALGECPKAGAAGSPSGASPA